MNDDSRRRVTMFMIAGVVVAIIAGLAVWKMSLPSSPQEPDYRADGGAARESAPTSTRTTAGTSNAASSSSPSPAEPGATQGDPAAAERAPSPAGTPRGSAAAPERDPLLPPNAVVNAAPRASAPTQVYRPSNVVPPSVAREPGSGQGDTPASTASGTGEPVTPAPGTTGGTATATGTTPPGGTPTSPTPGSTEPTPAGTPANPQTATAQPGDVASLLAPDGTTPHRQAVPSQAVEQVDPASQQVQQYDNPGSDSAAWWNHFWGYFRN